MLTAVSGRYANTVTYTYDTAGRKKTEGLTISGQTYTTTTAYNNRNELIQYTYPDSTVIQRTYTDRGELYQNKLASTVIDTRIYDNGGRMTASTYDNGVAETRTYGTDNTLTAINFGGTGTSIGNLAYGWDANKNKTSESIGGTMSNYGFTVPSGTSGYDNEDRLVGFNRVTGLTQSWNLSLVGDWNSVTTNGTSQSRTHGPTHELLTGASQNVTTDVKGDITLIPAALRSNAQSLATTWDFDNRMMTADVGNNGSVEVSQKYDALGRRVSRTEGSTTTVFVLSGQQVICDYLSGAAPATSTYKYLYGSYIDEPILRVTTTGSVKTYYHRNQQYSIVAMTNSSGAVQERFAYTAYGQITIANASGTVLTTSGDNNRHMYTGREWDSITGQYYYRARMYDASLGRFCSRDPIGFRGGLNYYHNNFLLAATDPRGLQTVEFDPKGLCQKTRDNRAEYDKKGGQASLPVLPGPNKSNCEEDVFYHALFSLDKDVTRIWNQFGSDCQKPKFECGCCPEGYGGFFTPGSDGGTLKICTKDGALPKNIDEILKHEGTHALQNCFWKDTNDDCDKSIKFELEAYGNGGSCDPNAPNGFETCLNRAITSSCWGRCTNADSFTPDRVLELKRWFEQNKNDFGTFPRSPDYPSKR